MKGRNPARIAFFVTSHVAHMQLAEYGTIEGLEILDYASSIQACSTLWNTRCIEGGIMPDTGVYCPLNWGTATKLSTHRVPLKSVPVNLNSKKVRHVYPS